KYSRPFLACPATFARLRPNSLLFCICIQDTPNDREDIVRSHVRTIDFDIAIQQDRWSRRYLNPLSPPAPVFNGPSRFPAGHSFLERFRIETNFLNQNFPNRAIQHAINFVFVDRAKQYRPHFVPFTHRSRLLIHIEGGRKLSTNNREPHHCDLQLIPELFHKQRQPSFFEVVTMWAIEVGELHQLHLARRMRGHLTGQDFELALQIKGQGSGWCAPQEDSTPYNRTDD